MDEIIDTDVIIAIIVGIVVVLFLLISIIFDLFD